MYAVVSRKRALAPSVMALALLAGSATAQDFNGDGISDIAIGSPGEDIAGAADAGCVTVIYGAGPGLGLQPLGPMPAVRITTATVGVGKPQAGDHFGAAMAWGNFNGDPFDDLAIGAPGKDHPLSGVADTGVVLVLYGSPAGLIPMNAPVWVQDPVVPPAMPLGDPGETGDDLGRSLAAGDFDGDGFDDLAFGVPGEDDPLGTVDIGIVHALYGCPIGLIVKAPPVIWQSAWPWGDLSETGDGFGAALATGDLDGDGSDDLAIGVPLEDFAGRVDTGMVNVAYGLIGVGIVPGGGFAQAWTQNSPGVPQSCQSGDHFGAALAIGDFDGAFGEDLAVGVPLEDLNNLADAGCVNVVYSAGLGFGLNAIAPPAPQPAELWHQNIPGVPEANGAADRFGASLTAGEFSGDPFEDLAISVPSEDVGGLPVVDAGCVHIIYGGPPGLGLDCFFMPTQLWHQNSAGVPDVAELGDFFGSSLTVGDFDANMVMDLAVGVPGESFGAAVGAGCIGAIYGSPGVGLSGLFPVPSQRWHQNSAGVPDGNESGDGFGGALDTDD